MERSGQTDPAAAFFRRGWVRFAHDPALAAWARAVRPIAGRLEGDATLRARWLRCGGTWFVGVNVLPNGPGGEIPAEGVPPLAGTAIRFVSEVLGFGDIAWDRAQVSVCHPGYPRPGDDESAAAFRFRRDRDAAHVDGLLRTMPGRRRRVGEAHGFILGVPLTETPPNAAPLATWEGSHEIMRAAFRERFAGLDPADWGNEDVTEAYVAARRTAFETCPRTTIHARPGEAYVVHRLALHGVAPWEACDDARPRAIVYFRPNPFPGAAADWWLSRP